MSTQRQIHCIQNILLREYLNLEGVEILENYMCTNKIGMEIEILKIEAVEYTNILKRKYIR